MAQLHARRYDTGEPVRVTWTGTQLDSVTPLAPTAETSRWPMVAPGLFDPQVNGYAGVWFSDPQLTADKVEAAVRPYLAMGVTRLFPTLITASHEALKNGLAAIRSACERCDWLAQMVAGCHLEGPYISPVDGCRGAHPREHVRPASWEEFCLLQEAAGGLVRLITLAPEAPYALDFIRKATAAGVIVSIGHTCAETVQIAAAVDAGARMSTHLGNGAQGMIRRHPNYIWDQLAEDRLSASLIVDGWHLPESVVRCMIRVKGTDRTVLTCDASGWAGCAPGVYGNHLGDAEVLDDGRIVVAGQRQFLAGSGVGPDTCVVKVIQFASVDLADAIHMAGRNAARLLGIPLPSLEPSTRADLMLFDPPQASDEKLRVRATVLAGQTRVGTLT